MLAGLISAGKLLFTLGKRSILVQIKKNDLLIFSSRTLSLIWCLDQNSCEKCTPSCLLDLFAWDVQNSLANRGQILLIPGFDLFQIPAPLRSEKLFGNWLPDSRILLVNFTISRGGKLQPARNWLLVYLHSLLSFQKSNWSLRVIDLWKVLARLLAMSVVALSFLSFLGI